MSIDTLHVCMYTPSAAGGHALYTQELLTALAEVGPGRGIAPELVTSEDLAAAHWTSAYPIHPIFPRLTHRSEYRTALVWAWSRMIHYTRLEQIFLDWLTGRQDLNLIHFQEYTCWLAPRHFRELRRHGLAIVMTVHNISSHSYYNNIHRLIRVYFEKSVFRRCDALLVHSEGLREALSDYLEGVHPPIHVTPHGVWRAAGRSVRPMRAVDGPRERLLFFGAIRPNKGLHVLLRALELLPQCDLTVAGEPVEPRYFEQVRDLARRLPPGRVELIDRFVGEQEVADLFGRSSLVVLPYTSFGSQSGVLHQRCARTPGGHVRCRCPGRERAAMGSWRGRPPRGRAGPGSGHRAGPRPGALSRGCQIHRMHPERIDLDEDGGGHDRGLSVHRPLTGPSLRRRAWHTNRPSGPSTA